MAGGIASQIAYYCVQDHCILIKQGSTIRWHLIDSQKPSSRMHIAVISDMCAQAKPDTLLVANEVKFLTASEQQCT